MVVCLNFVDNYLTFLRMHVIRHIYLYLPMILWHGNFVLIRSLKVITISLCGFLSKAFSLLFRYCCCCDDYIFHYGFWLVFEDVWPGFWRRSMIFCIPAFWCSFCSWNFCLPITLDIVKLQIILVPLLSVSFEIFFFPLV